MSQAVCVCLFVCLNDVWEWVCDCMWLYRKFVHFKVESESHLSDGPPHIWDSCEASFPAPVTCLIFFSSAEQTNWLYLSEFNKVCLIACYATQRPALSVRWLVGCIILFVMYLRSLASLFLSKSSSDLKYCTYPLAYVWGDRVSGLLLHSQSVH